MHEPTTKTSAVRSPTWQRLWKVVAAMFAGWWTDNAQRLGASLAFYTLFSVSPVLVVAVMCVGLFYGSEAAQGQIADQLAGIMGKDAAQGVQSLIASTRHSGGSPLATTLSLAVLLFGASGAFAELQSGLNIVWKIESSPNASWWHTIQRRGFTFLMVFLVGVLILAIVLANSALAAAQQWIGDYLPLSAGTAKTLNYPLTLLIETTLFAIIFKYLPDGRIAWKDVWLGALVTASLFSIGNLLIGLYLGYSAVQSAYGAAGSLMVFLLWTYYSAQIIYLGAEFTHAYACIFGSKIIPQAGAEAISEPCAATNPNR